MSSGSLIELSALGSLDQAVAQLAGKHRISPWSGTTPSSTNFAVDYNISTLQSGKQNSTAAQEMTFKLNRAGDLCHAAILEIRLPKLGTADGSGSYVWAAGYKAVQSCKLVIGGQEIEKFSGRWLEMQSEITQAPGIKPLRTVNKFSSLSNSDLKKISKDGAEGHIVLHVPLSYYFTQSTAKALRSVALAYHDVEFRVKLCDFNELVTIGTTAATSNGDIAHGKKWEDCEIKLITGSVYLDAHEREETARACVEQVVCMTQALTDVDSKNGRSWGSETDFTIDNIPFNHPTRMLVVAVADSGRLDVSVSASGIASKIDGTATGKWSDDGIPCNALPKNDFDYRLVHGGKFLQHSLSKIALKLNNHDRLSSDLHAGFYNTTTTAMVGYVPRTGIYVIPFSLNVRAEAGGMAIGSLNLSRVDRTSMTLTCPEQIANKEVFLYASSYNVISTRNGMLGVRFSN